jgi:hypothetical protein
VSAFPSLFCNSLIFEIRSNWDYFGGICGSVLFWLFFVRFFWADFLKGLYKGSLEFFKFLADI